MTSCVQPLSKFPLEQMNTDMSADAREVRAHLTLAGAVGDACGVIDCSQLRAAEDALVDTPSFQACNLHTEILLVN